MYKKSSLIISAVGLTVLPFFMQLLTSEVLPVKARSSCGQLGPLGRGFLPF